MTALSPLHQLPPFDHDPASWCRPIALDEFRTRYWRQRPLMVPGGPDRLRLIEHALGSFDLRHLLTWAREPMVQAWYVDEGRPDFSLKVPVEAAYRLYRAGLTIYFHLRDEVFDTPLLRAFSAALGHPNEWALLSIFATRKGKRTPAHVDHNENFTVQLTGHKRWGYCLDHTRRVPLEQWNDGAAAELPMESAHLTPGSLLYLPGPWLHETEDLADSISLNVCFPNISWAKYLAPALTRTLERDAHWSQEASSLREGTPEALASARRQLDDLTRTLHERLTLDPEALIQRSREASQIAPHDRFRLSPHASAHVLRPADGSTRLIIQSAWDHSALELEPEALALCAWIARQSEFAAEEAARASGLELDDVATVLATLTGAGYLVPSA
jgi:ribosomal protein L16 Arg81 hydroxylase